MSRGLTIGPDVLDVGFQTVQLPHPPIGYRNVSTNADGLQIVVTRRELQELKRLLNEMDLECAEPQLK